MILKPIEKNTNILFFKLVKNNNYKIQQLQNVNLNN